MSDIRKRLSDLERRVKTLEEFQGRASRVVNMHTPIGPPPRSEFEHFDPRTLKNLKMKIRVKETPKLKKRKGGGA